MWGASPKCRPKLSARWHLTIAAVNKLLCVGTYSREPGSSRVGCLEMRVLSGEPNTMKAVILEETRQIAVRDLPRRGDAGNH